MLHYLAVAPELECKQHHASTFVTSVCVDGKYCFVRKFYPIHHIIGSIKCFFWLTTEHIFCDLDLKIHIVV